MHIEVLVEDSSGKALLDLLLPKIVGEYGNPHTWRVHPYKGIGRIPPDMKGKQDPVKRMMLDQLPRLLRGYGKTPGIDAVVVVLDNDTRDCERFLRELRRLQKNCKPAPNTLFRLAIEEIEAWYFGDRDALLSGYPKARKRKLNEYVQDSLCGTWEKLADAIYPGGVTAVKKIGWPKPGQIKHEWARQIGPHMDPAKNSSPSFGKLRDGLLRLVGAA